MGIIGRTRPRQRAQRDWLTDDCGFPSVSFPPPVGRTGRNLQRDVRRRALRLLGARGLKVGGRRVKRNTLNQQAYSRNSVPFIPAHCCTLPRRACVIGARSTVTRVTSQPTADGYQIRLNRRSFGQCCHYFLSGLQAGRWSVSCSSESLRARRSPRAGKRRTAMSAMEDLLRELQDAADVW